MSKLSDLDQVIECSEGLAKETLLYGKPQLTVAAAVTTPKTPRLRSWVKDQSHMKPESDHERPCLLSLPRHVPWATPRSTELICSSAAGGSKHRPGVSGSTHIELILRNHKEEVMNELKVLLSRHEHSMERALSEFSEFLEVRKEKSVPPSSPTSIRSKMGGASYGTTSELSRKSDRRTTTASENMPAVARRGSETAKMYISMEDMREQCLAKDRRTFHRGSTSFGRSHSMKQISRLSDKARFVVNSFFFELLFGILICANSVLLGFEVGFASSSPTAEVPHVFYYLSIFFAFAFLTELCIRLVSEGGLVSFLFYSELRSWNWFDFLVVICSLVEVSFNFVLLGGGAQSVTRIIRMARMSRLGRIFRIARIVRYVSQLRILVISIMSTLQTLVWALFLLFIMIYVFGVLLAQATAEYFAEDPNPDQSEAYQLEHYWGSLQAAMYTLFMSIAGGLSWEAAVFAVAEVHWIWAALFTCFIAFATFVMINVMTAVVCQKGIETAQKDMEAKWQAMRADKEKHIKILKRLFQSMDKAGKGTITLKKLISCWETEAMQAFLHSMELEPDDCWTFFQILDQQDKEVNAADFVDGCLRLKGQAKAFDIAVMTYELRHLSKQNVDFMNQMLSCMHAILGSLEMGSDDLEPSELGDVVLDNGIDYSPAMSA